MVTKRRFAQFQRGIAPPRMGEIPEGGLCLSAFIVISKNGSPNHALMGRLNKDAPWDHIGALDQERVQRHGNGWLLPSSHLILGEGPNEAAERILKEQLGLANQAVNAPLLFSEVYGPKNHGDLEFIFLGEREEASLHRAWSELKFVDLTTTREEEIARSHQDILAHVHRWNPI